MDFNLNTTIPVTKSGIEKRVNNIDILMPSSDKKPKKVGPKIAPKRPIPTAYPTPVARISVGYTLERIAYNPLNPP